MDVNLAYNRKNLEISRLLETINDELNKHAVTSRGRNYGHVGDLEEVASNLRNIVSFLQDDDS